MIGPVDAAAVLARIERACFAAGARSEAALSADLAAPGRWALAEDTENGYAMVRLTDATADLEQLAVVPAARRAGLGTALLAAAAKRARTEGARRMLLEVREDNAAARGLYLREGFTEIARRGDYYGAGVAALVLERALP